MYLRCFVGSASSTLGWIGLCAPHRLSADVFHHSGGSTPVIKCLISTLLLAIVGCSRDKLDCGEGTHEEAGACVPSGVGDSDTATGPDEDTGEDGDTGGPPPVTYSSLDEVLEPLRAEWGLPSLGAAVVTGAEVTELGAVGLRSAESEVSVTHSDKFHLGSNTKAMTASLTARLVEEGVVEWDTTMAEAFPDLAIHEDFQGVTLQMMLAHVSGLSTSIEDDVWSPLWTSGDVETQRAWFVEQMLLSPPSYDPGTAFMYSNSGYMIVGAALEAATGTSWEALLTAEVFEPLGIDGCGFGAPDADGSLSQPWGHSSRDGAPMDGSSLYADNPPAVGPAGTVHCDLQSWGRFVGAHLQGSRGESGWLSTESFERLHTPVLDSSALGWFTVSRTWAGDRPALNHSGSNTMFYSVAWLAPSLNQAWLVTTNIGDAGSSTDAVVGELIFR